MEILNNYRILNNNSKILLNKYPDTNTFNCYDYNNNLFYIKYLKHNLCFYTSFLFLINVIVAYLKNNYVYSLLFLLLFISSTIYHYKKNNKIILLDKLFVYLVVIYGGYVFYKKIIKKDKNIKNLIIITTIIITFLITLYLYFYGYIYNKYCYDKDIYLAEFNHGILHFISMFGHLLIILF